jgi:hypothetical protein
LDLFGLDSVNSIFHDLKYAPVLQQLSLRSVAINLEDLEIIHENAPSLKALKLEWAYIKHGNGYPSNIVPATGLTTLYFTVYDVSNLNTHISFYKYINQKYANIVDIKHKDIIRYNYDDHNCKLLYTNGYPGFLKLIAQRQGRSYLREIQDSTDMFEVVNPANPGLSLSRMRNVDLYRHRLQVSQFQNIHTLALNNTEPNTPDVLKYMPVLTTLKLHFARHNDPPHIDLTPYFNDCPDSVKCFDIDCFQVEFYPSMMRECYIESLNINCNVISSNLFDLTERCLPALLRLKLPGSIIQREAIRLDKKHPLEEFTFVLDGRKPLAFTLKDNRDYHQYLCNNGDTRLATWDDIKELPKMAIISYIPRRVVIDGQGSIRVVLD